jgi:GNAT superfamily N-acetyltransferase
MQIRAADAADETDVGHLAELLERFAGAPGPTVADRLFAPQLLAWWHAHHESHLPFLALTAHGRPVGMAWLAVVARVPRPGALGRRCGDLQSVFVMPDHRSAGVGTALVQAVLHRADELELEHVTVHGNERAASLYARSGFEPSGNLLLRYRQ